MPDKHRPVNTGASDDWPSAPTDQDQFERNPDPTEADHRADCEAIWDDPSADDNWRTTILGGALLKRNPSATVADYQAEQRAIARRNAADRAHYARIDRRERQLAQPYRREAEEFVDTCRRQPDLVRSAIGNLMAEDLGRLVADILRQRARP